MKRKITFVLLVCILCAFLTGCTEDDTLSRQEIAEIFVERTLTLPDEQIAEIAVSSEYRFDDEIRAEKLLEAMEALCGEYVAAGMLADDSSFYSEIMSMHAVAAGNGYSYVVTDIEVTQTDETHFSYIAIVDANNADDPLEITGNIQFNDDDLIDYMGIRIK